MAYNEQLTDRVRELLAELPDVEEKKMFKGLTFMVNGKMCICVSGDELMCRIDPAMQDELAEHNGTREMMRNGQGLKGFLYVDMDTVKTRKELNFWVQVCLDFNDRAKATKKKKRA